MFSTFVLLFLTLPITSHVYAQRAFLGFPSEEIQETCRQKINVTANQVTQWEAESVNCVDRFEEIKEAACFHSCILQQYGSRDENYDPVIPKLVDHIFYINPKQVEKLIRECYRNFNGTDPCFRAYHVQKCIDKSIGKYPRGAKHVPIDLVSDNIAEKCRIKLGMTQELLCSFEQAIDYDLCESTPIPRCYHQCILTELGYVQNEMYPNIRTYRNRYFYIDDVQFIKTFLDCWFSLQNNGECSQTYQMYKCMKTKFGEYPPQVLPPYDP